MNPWEYTILIVEDEADQVFMLKRAFQKANVRNPIQVFRDGQEVIDHLTKLGSPSRGVSLEAPPALMLLDLKMPRKTGFEVLEWLRHQPRLRSLVVVVLSNSLQLADVSRAYELGCNSYLMKPANLDHLVEMVRMISSYWVMLNVNPDLHYIPDPFRPF